MNTQTALVEDQFFVAFGLFIGFVDTKEKHGTHLARLIL